MTGGNNSYQSTMTKYIKVIPFIFIISFSFCKKDTLIENNPVLNNDTCQLEIDKSYRIYKVSYLSHLIIDSYKSEYKYYEDSIVITSYYQNITYITTYYISTSGLADSCDYRSNSGYSAYRSKSYFSYDSEGYLKSKRDRTLDNNGSTILEFSDTYDYTTGNLTKVTFDPKKPSLTGKYVIYTYNYDQNLIDLESFKGSWLGKLNKNLVKSTYTGGSMSDTPPCTNYQYTLNQEGLVETKTLTSCKLSNNYRTIITYEYKIIDF